MLFYRISRTVRGVFGFTSRSLTVSAVLCVVTIIINALVWDHLPEPFNGTAALASAGIDLLLAYVAGYIFYIVTSVYPEYKKQQLIYCTVMHDAFMDIAKAYADLISDLAFNSKHIEPLDVFRIYGSKEGQQLLVEAAKPLMLTGGDGVHIYKSWLTYMTAMNNLEKKCIEKMLRFDNDIELNIRVLLVDLLHTDYVRYIGVLNMLPDKEAPRPCMDIIYKLHIHLYMLLALQNHILSIVVGKRL
ncbi:hypothetical protein ACLHZ0_20255 [Aeromonas salmonicida]|uniref:hypothetical protein n=1 Tax=Aeromonas salmonicida TaxID=645 RepID=UPI003CFC141C